MWQFIVFLLLLGLIGKVLGAIGAAVYVIFFFVISPIVGIKIAFSILRAIYHLFNPNAKKAFLDKKAKKAEENRKREKQEREAEKAKKEKEEAENRAWMEREAEKRRKIEFERQSRRDSDQQAEPYKYQIGQHGNESLAIRYGIANQERKVKEYWHFAKGGEKKRNPDRDEVYYKPASTIRLQKTERVGNDLYKVMLTDYRDREAIAVIEAGAEYVKTFYPLEESWFKKYEDLETTLKGNGSFTLKELATFHVQKTVGS